MGAIRTGVETAFPDFEIPGVPASGAKKPIKPAIRAWGAVIDTEVEAVRAVAQASVLGIAWVPSSQAIRVRSTGNVVIASALENGDTLNGVTLATGDHVLLVAQTAPAENGIYTVAASGAASRATFADSAAELARIGVVPTSGTVGAGELWVLPLAAANITVGTTALNFANLGAPFSLLALPNTWAAANTFNTRLNVDTMTLGRGGQTVVASNSAFGIEALDSASLTGDRNSGFGRWAGRVITSGEDNTVVGAFAGSAITTANACTAFGSGALSLNTTGSHNNAVGARALSQNVTGIRSIAIGTEALFASTSGRNIAIGYRACFVATTAQFNTVIGEEAGQALTTGSSNDMFGINAGFALTTGSENAFVGGGAGSAATTATRNTFVGNVASAGLVTGTENVAIGFGSALAATSGDLFVAIGANAGASATAMPVATTLVGANAGFALTTGISCTALGRNALNATTTGAYNTAIGSEALVANIAGTENTACGSHCLDANQGDRNTGLGLGAGYRQTDGHDNLFAGYSAGRGLESDPNFVINRCVVIGSDAFRTPATGSDDNTFIGYKAGFAVTTGADNVLIGSGAGDSLTTGDNNIVIGKDADTAGATDSNRIVIGSSSHTHATIAGVTFTKAQLEALLALVS